MWNLVFNSSMDDDDDLAEIVYADDKAILIEGNCSIKIEETAQKAMDKFITWCQKYKLEISVPKTIMLQLNGRYDHRRPPTLKLTGERIKIVKTVLPT